MPENLFPGTTGLEDIAAEIMALAGNQSLARQLRENDLAATRSTTWDARARRILSFCETLA